MGRKEFKLPYMVLNRGDLEFMGGGISTRLTNAQMQEIANKLGKILAQDWDSLLRDMRIGCPEMFRVR